MRLAAILFLVALPAFAEQPQPSEAERQAIMQALAEQRNQQADIVAALSARLRATEAALAEAKKAAESCKPKEEPKK